MAEWWPSAGPPSAEPPSAGLWASIGDDGRDPRLAYFASGGKMDGALPSGQMLGLLECLAVPYGPEDRPFAGATHDEAAGMLAAAQMLEGHVAALKLALVREVIRRHAPAAPAAPTAPDATDATDDAASESEIPPPSAWRLDVLHEIAAILRISVRSADPVADLAWQLEARLPGVGELLDAGVLSWLTARIIVDEFRVLDDGAADDDGAAGDKLAAAQKRLLDHNLAGDSMTPGHVRRLCQRIVDTVDPEGAAQRREEQERNDARVQYYRSHGGAGALFATGLPPDEALKSEANVQKRALEYKNAGIKEKMDFLRVLALVDLTNGVPVPARLALWQAESNANTSDPGDDNPGNESSRNESPGHEDGSRSGDDRTSDDGTSDHEPGSHRPSDHGTSSHRPSSAPSDHTAPGPGTAPSDGGAPSDHEPGAPGARGPAPAGMPDPGLPTLANMTYPLATVLGQADRPGEAAGYGSLDPALVRKLASAAAASPRSRFCVTFTDHEGHAAAHGCARLIQGTARLIHDTVRLVQDSRPPPGAGWAFTRDTTRAGPEGGYGAWILTLPGGARYRVDMHAIPLHSCDHRYATDAYRPGNLLRHLVQVRDGECTFTGCSQPARNSDFEHTIPHHKGGATDACNAGMRSRRCHRVKQSPGWTVTQPEPGWHRWEAPSGRSYTKGPKDYPA